MLRSLVCASCVLLGLGPAPQSSSSPVPVTVPASERPKPEAEAEAEAPEPPVESAGADQAEPAASERTEPGDVVADPQAVADVILPSGLRVIAARDASLPVAAVVLSVEVGTRDDPEKLPGLVHALAYHLQQGNRELAPGEAIATAHDAGGLAGMAVGQAQVRFEALIPVSTLDAQLRIESLRLRAPNTGRELWLKSLSYARNDEQHRSLVPHAAAAVAWDDPGIDHDGRAVGQALGEMSSQSLGTQLAYLYDYRVATLVIVAPDDPQALVERVAPLFSDLSARPRKPPPHIHPPATQDGPRVAPVAKQAGDSLLWAVPGHPSARAWAQVLCGTINRQARGQNDPPKARLRCTYADDPRRPLLLVRASGYEPAAGPEPLIAARLDRIAAADQAEPELAALVEQQRERIATDLEFDLRAPLDLAIQLASASERSVDGPALRPRAEVLGLPLVPSSADGGDPGAAAVRVLRDTIPELFDTRRAVLLIDPELEVPPPLHAPSARDDVDAGGEPSGEADEPTTSEGAGEVDEPAPESDEPTNEGAE